MAWLSARFHRSAPCFQGQQGASKETRMSTTPQTGVGVIQEVCREIFSCSHPRRLAVRPDGRVVFLKIAPCSW